MIDVLEPWYFGLRGLALRAPVGVRTPPNPVPAPPGLEAPETLPEGENGYLRLAAHVANWPSEGHPPPDLNHRRKALPKDRKAAERALLPLRPLLEGLNPILGMPEWQVPLSEDHQWPELRSIRRLSHALLLRGALEDRESDRERVLAIAQRLRRAQSPLLHFLVGIGLEKTAEGPFDDLLSEREEAVRWELARVIIPSAHRSGPWEPESFELPPRWRDDARVTQWLLAKHPLPYDPAEKIAMLLQERDLMATGSGAELRERAATVGAGWPRAMLSLRGQPTTVPLATVFKSRDTVQRLDNPYGRLSVARTLHAMASVADAVEKNLKPRSADGDAPPGPAEAS